MIYILLLIIGLVLGMILKDKAVGLKDVVVGWVDKLLVLLHLK